MKETLARGGLASGQYIVFGVHVFLPFFLSKGCKKNQNVLTAKSVINHNPKGCCWTRGDARGTDRGRAAQQSQAKDFANRVKYLTRDTAIGKQRMPENQRENAEEKSTPSSFSGNQSGK